MCLPHSPAAGSVRPPESQELPAAGPSSWPTQQHQLALRPPRQRYTLICSRATSSASMSGADEGVISDATARQSPHLQRSFDRAMSGEAVQTAYWLWTMATS